MDPIKEAFQKIKKDIDILKEEFDYLKKNLLENREKMIELCEIIKNLSEKKEIYSIDKQTNRQTNIPTHNQTIQHINSTTPTDFSTDSTHINVLKPQNLGISTGNEGVPTNRQTDKQTNQQTDYLSKSVHNPPKNSIDNTTQFLESLDDLKKELRLKFKRLTEQEFLVFSTLYQLTEQEGEIDYRTLSKKLNLSESSIRDYIGRLIKKGIPVEKIKINNKNISLSISKNLKKIATLPTILQLRGI